MPRDWIPPACHSILVALDRHPHHLLVGIQEFASDLKGEVHGVTGLVQGHHDLANVHGLAQSERLDSWSCPVLRRIDLLEKAIQDLPEGGRHRAAARSDRQITNGSRACRFLAGAEQIGHETAPPVAAVEPSEVRESGAVKSPFPLPPVSRVPDRERARPMSSSR